MVDTKRIADKMAKHYETRDPVEIAKERGYIIMDLPLDGIRGFYQYAHRRHIIYLDNRLSERERCWVCAHELGHAVMHQGLNRVFMDTQTHFVTSRYEIEADRFAADLLFPDDVIAEYLDCTIETTARELNISEGLAAYRLQRVLKSGLSI